MKKIIGVLLCLTVVMIISISCKSGKQESADFQDSRISESSNGNSEKVSSSKQTLSGESGNGNESVEETSDGVSSDQTEREFTKDYEIPEKGDDIAEEEEQA